MALALGLTAPGLQVGILSEGRSVYFGAPSLVVNWFDKHLGYSYSPTTHGSVSDWVIDLVTPSSFSARILGHISVPGALLTQTLSNAA